MVTLYLPSILAILMATPPRRHLTPFGKQYLLPIPHMDFLPLHTNHRRNSSLHRRHGRIRLRAGYEQEPRHGLAHAHRERRGGWYAPGRSGSTSNLHISSSPAVANGVVYIGSPDHRLYALDATTGKILWQYETGDTISFSSPAVANGVVYVGSDDKTLHAVDAATGKGLWKYTTGGKIKSSPLVDNGVVYVGSYDSNLYALDATTGKVRQVYQTNGQIFTSPRIVDGVLYFASYDNYVYAFKL